MPNRGWQPGIDREYMVHRTLNVEEKLGNHKEGFVSVDGAKIFYGAFHGVNWHLNGQFCPFEVHKDRCQEVDDEYAVILNLHGFQKATEYAISKGYLTGDSLKTEETK